MESLSRSSHRRKPSTTSANVFPSSFSFKNPYGDVLLSNGGERKSLRLHEYSEIFAGSSSIPVLDLPGLDERVGSGDVRSSKLDYTSIFGGLAHAEVFVPYEELLKKAKTRIPAERMPYLKESGSRLASRKTESPPGAASDQSVDGFKLKESGSLPYTIKSERPSTQSVDGGKLQESGSRHPSRKMERPFGVTSNLSFDEVEQQLSMSFNRTNQKNCDASNAKIHTTKLHAVPGFTHFVDESRPHKGKNDRPPLLKRDVSRSWSFSAEVEPAKTKGGSSFEKSRVRDNSHNVNENNIKSQSLNTPMPSSYPLNPSNIKEPWQSKAFNFASKRDVSQNIAGESSEEFEDNSADAASASALKKAVEQAQESIRIAKMMMEKKRDCYQDGSKPRPISSVRVADAETQIEAFALNENSTRRKYDRLDTVFPILAQSKKKLTPSVSHNGTFIHAEYSAGGSVSGSAETDIRYGETFVRGTKLFAPNHIRSKTTHVDENITLQLEKNVEAAEEQTEEKTFPEFGSIDLEPAKLGSINSLLLSAKELASNLGRLETSKETIECRNVTTNHTKGSEVPLLVEEPVITAQRTHAGMEKSLEDGKLCRTTFDHVEGLENKEVRVLNSSQKNYEHNNILDEASEGLRIRQQDVVTELRKNDMNHKEQHEEKLEECEAVINTSFNSGENAGLEQEEMEKKTQGDVHRCAKTDAEEINGTRQTGSHFCKTKEQLKEHLLEAINGVKLDAHPEVGEFENKVDEAHEPKINNSRQNYADNIDDLKLPEEHLQNQVEEEHVNTSKYEASRTITMEAIHCANFRKREAFSEDEKTDNTLRGASRSEDNHNDQFQEASHGEDIDEPVNLSSNIDSMYVAHTDETSNINAGTPESYHVESNSKREDQGSVKNLEENVPKSKGAVSVIGTDEMAEQSFNLQDDEMLRTDYLHRSASEEIFVENNLHGSYEGLRSHSRTESIDFLDADPEENLSEDKDASITASDIHAAAREHATEIDRRDIPEVLCSHIRTVDVEQVLEQTVESDEGSLSTSSCEKIDELSGQESEVRAEHVKDTTSSKEELRDEMIYDEQKCVEDQSEGLESQLHDKPKETDKPLETEEALDTDVDRENDKADLAGTSPVDERDAKEGFQNFESNDQQQRIQAIKRGREQEKDRIAVERAIREARERAFSEVRERAAVERAATGVRQRIVEKPHVGKASIEAKLRDEWSAVERATAEARERALQTARLHKNSEDKRFSTSPRNYVLKHSFSSSDLETGMNSESAQRRKARLERHQRIMERAEKALAEKNMRDLLAQKEQAERNRLAESLDLDIKRWATGKEGNLRALLSTLQYILGPDSGWQSISLTEIITTPAVKKAYRKATLSVHPDKLQQRGAGVQQKYICEKVFDLLKAAWTRFNSDERSLKCSHSALF